MLISARRAAAVLAGTAGLARQQARRVLLAELAGPALLAGNALLYDEDRVAALGRRQRAAHAELLAECPGGLFVLRLGRGIEVSALAPWPHLAAAVGEQTGIGFAARLQARAHLQAFGPLPFVATVCGFPVLLADLHGVHDLAEHRIALDLERASAWQHLLEQRRLVTSPGPSWLILGSQPYLGRAQRARESGQPVGACGLPIWSGGTRRA